jgi:serine/threonine-protein kinase
VQLEPGQRVDRYELLYPIARGGMAVVWLCRAHGVTGFSRLFVMKAMLTELAPDAATRAMFFDEVRLTSSIHHPHVAPVIDAGERDGLLFLVMDYVEGASLARALDAAAGAHVPARIAARIVLDVLAGLHAAHELRAPDGRPLDVVHRDVSPQNILLTSFGDARVLDFGIAKATARVSGDTASGDLKGKPRFMAPEAISRSGFDRRSDVWSVGCVLHLLLAGRDAFDAPNDMAVLYRVVAQEPSPLPEDVAPRLRSVVQTALARDPAERFSTAQAFATALADAVGETDTIASHLEVAEWFRAFFATQAKEHARELAEAEAAIALRPPAESPEPEVRRPPPRLPPGAWVRILAWTMTVGIVALTVGQLWSTPLGHAQVAGDRARPSLPAAPVASAPPRELSTQIGQTAQSPASSASATPPVTPRATPRKAAGPRPPGATAERQPSVSSLLDTRQ